MLLQFGYLAYLETLFAFGVVSLSQRTGCWGFQKYPVICGLSTTRFAGMKLLQGRPAGTFLLRLSSKPGALAAMYVKPMQEASQDAVETRMFADQRST